MDSFTFDAVVIAAVLLLTVASMGGWLAALIGEPRDERMYRASQTSPAIGNAADRTARKKSGGTRWFGG
jgi:hypothetical protein